jgi:hypothetical protein
MQLCTPRTSNINSYLQVDIDLRLRESLSPRNTTPEAKETRGDSQCFINQPTSFLQVGFIGTKVVELLEVDRLVMILRPLRRSDRCEF